jgi:1,4-alpha-glucan branching enzyme
MKKVLVALAAIFLVSITHAQLLSWTPDFPKEDDPSQVLKITVDATKGNQGLLNYTPLNDVFVHIGVITNKSASGTDWKYSQFTWGQTTPAANAPAVGTNKWEYTINGSLRTFFGITDPTEKILKIAILFRSGNGSKAQRNADATDMYVPVYSTGLSARITEPFRQPTYNAVAETQSWIVGTNFSFQGKASVSSSMKLYHNGTQIAAQSGVQTISGNSTVTAAGNQQLVVEANDGTTTKYDTLNIFVAPLVYPSGPLPAGVRDGINYGTNDTVILVLHAPEKNKVVVIGDFNDWTENLNSIMTRTPDGQKYWIKFKLPSGGEYAYQYKVDDTIRIADPYAEKILDPWNDQYILGTTYPALKPYPTGKTTGIVSVLQTQQPAYTWAVNSFSRPDKRGLVIYELLLRDFVAAHDWKTLRDTLPYLQKLGINAIEIMPFNEFEGNEGWGYNPDFYFAPDKYYGTKNALKEFIDSAHKKGIAVIMDIALNHSYGLSPLVQLYFNSATGRPAGNNPWYNQVPKHAYNVGFDFNHESLDTRYFTSRVAEHWLKEYKIDGFRFDLSKGFTQNQTCDNNGGNCNTGAMAAYDASRIAIWKRYYDSVQTKSSGAYVILEHFADNNEEKELASYGMMLWGNLNYAYLNAVKGLSPDWDLSWGFANTRGWNDPHVVTYMESHDEERLMFEALNNGNSSGTYNIKDTTIALKRAELAAAFFLTIPGPKMIWQFGELGYHYSINRCADGSYNNGCRLTPKPIRWDFLADPRRKKIHDVYTRLNQLRFHPWYKAAFMTTNVEKSVADAFKWIRITTDSSKMVVIGNFSVVAQNQSVNFPTGGTWYNYLDSTTISVSAGANSFTLQPGEYRVYLNRNVNATSPTPVINIPLAGSELVARTFPNPARSYFNLEIYLPSTGKLGIELFNAVGQRVGTLHDGLLQKGKHLLTLQRDQQLAPGTYFLSINTKTTEKTIPITLQ